MVSSKNETIDRNQVMVSCKNETIDVDEVMVLDKNRAITWVEIMALNLFVTNNYTFAMYSIDLDVDWLVEADVADVFGLADGR